MKKSLIIPLLSALLLGGSTAWAEEAFLNLTPAPKSITQSAGTFALKDAQGVSTSGLDEAMTAEVNSALAAINEATGLTLATTDAAVVTTSP